MGRLRFGILGPLEAFDEERSLALGGPKQRALLAILLLRANEPVSRDRLIEGIWGEQPPPSGVQSLDSYVSRLRKLIGAERIERHGGGYVLRLGPGELDLEVFERLAMARRYAEALAVWRGPALADLLYEPFAQLEADRLEKRRLHVLEERIEADLAAGSGPELVAELEVLVQTHPFRERLVAQLILALYRAGRQTAALEAYRRAKRDLADELGLEPGPQLQELERRILAHDPGLGRSRPLPNRSRPRRPLVLAVGASVVAAAVAVGVALSVHGSALVKTARADSSAMVAVDAREHRVQSVSVLPDAPQALAAGFGSLWIADPNGQQVLRVDSHTGEVTDRIHVPAQPSALAIGQGSVWVASAVGGLVTRLDPHTSEITQTERLGGANPSALLVVQGSVWVADQTDDSLVEIDAESGAPRRTIPLNDPPTALAASGGELWAASYASSTVEQIDLRSRQVVAELPVGQGPSAILAARGSLWVANSLDGTLTRIDALTGTTRSTVAVGSGPESLAAAAGSVWVANQYSGDLAEVDAVTGELLRTLRTGGRPTTVLSSGSTIWVGTGPSTDRHRGGTLRLSGVPPNSLDPAFAVTGSWEPSQLTRLIYDGLVTFDNAPGPAGLRLVPDLALELPHATDEGKTYVFHLRPGIRYSDGRLVRAGDFRRGLERLFRTRSPGRIFYSSIVGARRCLRRPVACDMSRGVIADNAAGTVTIRLGQADPDFLFKLTEFAYGAPVPPGTPDRELRWRPPPGTGPYRVVQAGPNGPRLERNRYFREWSHAAQPDGNPDDILWHVPASHAAGVRDIEQGKADWSFDFIPIQQLRRIQRLDPELLHVNPAFIVEFVPLNPNVPPFDSVKVRRALNYAIDRREIARLYGGPILGSPLCQPLPPGVPGYVRYCPYTLDADRGGSYHGPDLVRAKALVAASGRRNTRIVVQAVSDAFTIPPGEPAYIARVLRSLGFTVTVHTVRLNSITPKGRQSFQLSVDGDWLLDFPSAASFLPSFFECGGPRGNHYYCNPGLDRLMRQATSAETSNPAAAARLWAKADHTITDQAYWLPTLNLNEVDLVSPRLHNYEYNPVWGFLADQAWVR